jgi:hypothetical protein
MAKTKFKSYDEKQLQNGAVKPSGAIGDSDDAAFLPLRGPLIRTATRDSLPGWATRRIL